MFDKLYLGLCIEIGSEKLRHIIKQLIFLYVKRINLPELPDPDSREDNLLSVMYELSYWELQ